MRQNCRYSYEDLTCTWTTGAGFQKPNVKFELQLWMLGSQELPWSYGRPTSLCTYFEMSCWGPCIKHILKRESAVAVRKKKKKSKTLHAKRGGLFRCQEVCVMVMGQMREEGWSRPLCFEDSPSPPRPVQLHLPNPTPKPKNRQDQRGLTFVCTCLCMHLFWSVIFF